MFFLKKLIAPLLFPLPVCMMLLLAGLFLLWFTRRQRAGKIFTTIGVVLILLMSYPPLPDFFLHRIEQQYTPLEFSLHTEIEGVPESLSSVKWIVVLGGGHSSDPKVPASSNLYSGTLYRLIESIELHRRLPGSRLIVSGSGIWRSDSEAAAMARTAEALGVLRENIVLEEKSNDTEEQAMFIKPIVGTDAFILVTTASHMPRAVALFTKAGMTPIPAPTDYKITEASYVPRDYYPSPGNLYKSEVVVYETLGRIWSKLRGKE
ncbi:MAG: envelope biogenesis factor ElyC [Pyrinomonadaceae bacterium]|nr:envelope biogenesis factor ElyC [Pyrinomonadaceae bacterium]